MKKLFLLFIILLQAALFAEDKPQMVYWYGGKLNMSLLSSINTMGGGQGAGGFGRVIAPGVSYGPASIFTNPAEIGLLKSPVFYFDNKFSISLGTFGVDMTKELNKNISTETGSFLKDKKAAFQFTENGSNRIDSKFQDFEFGQTSKFGSFALAVPINEKMVLGFGVTYPIEFSINYLLSDARTKISQEKNMGGQIVAIDMPINTNFAFDFRFNVNMMNIGFASEVMNNHYGKTVVGVSLNRYEVSQFLNLNLKVDGMMVIKKKLEYHFNDPNDINIDRASGESNDFYWLARGNYKTDGWGFRLGAVHTYDRYNFVLVLDIVPKFKMKDKNFINKGYQPKFLTGRITGTEKKNENGDDVGDNLRIDYDMLQLEKPNLTTETTNQFSDEAETVYPSTLTLGADAKVGRFTFGLNLVKYLDDFSFTFADYQLGKKLNMGTKFSVDVQLPDTVKKWGYLIAIPRFFIDIDGLLFQFLQQAFKAKVKYKNPHYRIEGGVMFGDGIASGFGKPEDEKSLRDALNSPFPTGFALSKEYSVFDRVTVSTMVFGFPDFALRVGLGYNL